MKIFLENYPERKMFAHPYHLLKELVCKKFKVVLTSRDVDTIENANKSVASFFIDEIIGCQQWTPCSRGKITSLFFKSEETIRFSMRTTPPTWGVDFTTLSIKPLKSTPYNLENCLMIIGYYVWFVLSGWQHEHRYWPKIYVLLTDELEKSTRRCVCTHAVSNGLIRF